MKGKVLGIIGILILIVLFGSCVSIQDREMSRPERAEANVVGSVSISFTTFRFLHFTGNRGLLNKAHQELLREAQKQYGNGVEIRNIDIIGSGTGWQGVFVAGSMLPWVIGGIADSFWFFDDAMVIGVPAAGIINLIGHFQKITATGDVVLLDGSVQTRDGSTIINQNRMSTALENAARDLLEQIPNDSTVAVLSIFSDDRSASEFAVDEIEFALVRARQFHLVDRRRLEQIRREQNFQLSGEVDDNSAVSIGNLLGANIVITGEVSSNRLVLRALDVQTARIIAMAREQF